MLKFKQHKEGDFESHFSSALVLNAGYEPLKVISWQRAIILWFQEKVDILEYHEISVNSPSQAFRLPSVLILRKYIKPQFNRTVRLSRQNIFLRDEYRCQYCCKVFPKKSLTLDHVHPVSKGGQHTWENVVTACSACNNKKADRTVSQMGLKLYKKPVEPKWPLADERLSFNEHVPLLWKNYLSSLSWVG